MFDDTYSGTNNSNAGCLAVAMDNCLWPIVDQKGTYFQKKKKKKGSRYLSKGKLNRSFLDSF